MKALIKEKIWQQTVAGLITVVSFPFIYIGGLRSNSVLLVVGMTLLLAGMLAAPLITFFHGWNRNN